MCGVAPYVLPGKPIKKILQQPMTRALLRSVSLWGPLTPTIHILDKEFGRIPLCFADSCLMFFIV